MDVLIGVLQFVLGGALLLVILVVILGLPAIGFRFVLRWARARNYQWLARAWIISSASLVICFSWVVYSSIWPDEDFYRREFTRITKTALPAESQFQHKDASFPDQHGDYASYARVTVPDSAFNRLLHYIQHDTTWHSRAAPLIGGSELEDSLPPVRFGADRGDVSTGAYLFIGFLPDGHTFFFYRVSS